jgi:arylsulfatase A-like enzyme
MRRWRAIAAIAIATALIAGALAGSADTGARAGEGRPDIVVIQTDDQTLEQQRVMDRVNSLIGGRGATFADYIVNFPLCCPSRATLLTGQYAHNHGVLGNHAPLGGFSSLDSTNTLPVWLQDSGYRTIHVGKYLNEYGTDQPLEVPRGWSRWYTGTGGTVQQPYGYSLNENGRLVAYGLEPDDFKQDVFTDLAVDAIERSAARRRPFFLTVDYTAPHGASGPPSPQPPFDCTRQAQPAPRHADAFDDEPLPRPPSFNEADVSDKPRRIAELPPLTADQIETITRRYRCKLESLLSVDEGVARIIAALRDADALSNTYVVFTSDNGFFLGEHRIGSGKVEVYEPSSHLPLLIRGPGVRRGETVRDLATNADLAPTILAWAGARARLTEDGRSLVPALANPDRERGRELLIESRRYAAVRTQRYVYVSNSTGEIELYDLENDPDQLQNKIADPAYDEVSAALARRLRRLRDCAGADCRTRPSLELQVTGPGGAGCLRRGVAEVKGADRRELAEVEFTFAGQPVATDDEAPFRARLPLDGIAPGARRTAIATANLIDGRRLTIERTIRRCG